MTLAVDACAVVGSNNAARYQLAGGVPVMAVGGFNGTDPAPTLEQFKTYVAERKIHYFLPGALMHGGRGGDSGSRAAADIASWVQANFSPSLVDGVAVYDLTQTPKKS